VVQGLFSGASGDEAVIYVVLKSVVVFGIQGGKDVIHKVLHRGWAVCWAKGHYCWSIESLHGFEHQ